MKQVLIWSALTIGAAMLAVVGTYSTIPTHNSDATRFDVLIVLGSPPDPDGQPSSEERERVLKAVQELHAGRAPVIILSGGAAHSRQVEAEVMADVARSVGAPAGSLITEDHSKNTIENLYFSNEIMREHGWTSAEVVSSASHLARVALILEHYRIQWRTQACDWPPEYSFTRIGRYYLREALGTFILRWFGFRRSVYMPES